MLKLLQPIEQNYTPMFRVLNFFFFFLDKIQVILLSGLHPQLALIVIVHVYPSCHRKFICLFKRYSMWSFHQSTEGTSHPDKDKVSWKLGINS